jgi:hypothetical protein
LKRFLAPDFVFSLGIWLSCCRAHPASRETQWPAKMLARALKVHDYFRNETIRTGIDTAALDQPDDEGCAYGRAARDWQRFNANRRCCDEGQRTPHKMECTMPISTRITAVSAKSTRPMALSTIFFAALLAAVVAVPGDAAARAARATRGAYDGVWNVTFTPRQGNCFNPYNAPFIVRGRHVSSGGNGKVTGGVRPDGAVAVRLSVGLSYANGTGKLAARSGTGRWTGLITGDQCSGTWQATR